MPFKLLHQIPAFIWLTLVQQMKDFIAGQKKWLFTFWPSQLSATF
jgi:hypothetical protein